MRHRSAGRRPGLLGPRQPRLQGPQLAVAVNHEVDGGDVEGRGLLRDVTTVSRAGNSRSPASLMDLAEDEGKERRLGHSRCARQTTAGRVDGGASVLEQGPARPLERRDCAG